MRWREPGEVYVRYVKLCMHICVVQEGADCTLHCAVGSARIGLYAHPQCTVLCGIKFVSW